MTLLHEKLFPRTLRVLKTKKKQGFFVSVDKIELMENEFVSYFKDDNLKSTLK